MDTDTRDPVQMETSGDFKPEIARQYWKDEWENNSGFPSHWAIACIQFSVCRAEQQHLNMQFCLTHDSLSVQSKWLK